MGFEETSLALKLINHRLKICHSEGERIEWDYHGKPQFRIMSFEPIVYEKYGFFRNRAPVVAGSLVLREFLVGREIYSGDTVIMAAMQAEADTGYGFYLDGGNSQVQQVMEETLATLGLANTLKFVHAS